MKMNRLKPAVFLSCMLLSGCNVPERLSRIGLPPDMNNVQIYEPDKPFLEEENYNNGTVPHPGSQADAKRAANSLWKPGSRAFFRDQRARGIGDILTVVITVTEQAKFDNSTQVSRNDTGNSSILGLGGFENKLQDILPSGVNPANILNVTSVDSNNGIATIDRKETLNTVVAATVVRILPSNNLVIRGSQEIRVNNEIREVTIEGIVRPEDIRATLW
jgi:flagellar L-ring protein precursor FlgH